MNKKIAKSWFSPACLIGCILLLAATGCTSLQLKHDTLAQSDSYQGLEYEMVLDNVAMFNVAPDSLPWHLTLNQGIVTVNDTAGANLGYSEKANSAKGPPISLTGTVSANGSRAVTSDWKVTPISSYFQLAQLLDLYNSVSNFKWSWTNVTISTVTNEISTSTDNGLTTTRITTSLATNVTVNCPGAAWWHAGTPPEHIDTPTGSYGSKFIWVDKGNLANLNALTLQVMKIASETNVVFNYKDGSYLMLSFPKPTIIYQSSPSFQTQ